MEAGARASRLAELQGVGLSALQRWRRQFAGDGVGLDRSRGSQCDVSHRLTDVGRQRNLLTSNQPEYAAHPPGQIVRTLADQGLYIASERSCYRMRHANCQLHRQVRGRPPYEPRLSRVSQVDGPTQLWSWVITYLPTNVRGV